MPAAAVTWAMPLFPAYITPRDRIQWTYSTSVCSILALLPWFPELASGTLSLNEKAFTLGSLALLMFEPCTQQHDLPSSRAK